MKRFISLFLIIIVSFLLQTTVFHEIALADTVPNLLLIITVSIGFMRGRTEAMLYGLFCGLLVDSMYSDVLGIYALLYMIIGYLNGYAHKIYYKDDYTIPIVLVGVSDFVLNIFYYILAVLLRNRTDFFYYVRRIMLPEAVYTIFVSIFLYKLLHAILTRLENTQSKEV